MKWQICTHRLVIFVLILGGGLWLLYQIPKIRHEGDPASQGPLHEFLAFFAWQQPAIDFEVRSDRPPVLLPISTWEEFQAVSGEDAFWPMEIWARWDQESAPEKMRVCLKCFDSQGKSVSAGQIITMEKQSEKADSTGRFCYRPATQIAFVGSADLERCTEDRVGVFFRDGCETRVSFVD